MRPAAYRALATDRPPTDHRTDPGSTTDSTPARPPAGRPDDIPGIPTDPFGAGADATRSHRRPTWPTASAACLTEQGAS
jgi:hypothetical protein